MSHRSALFLTLTLIILGLVLAACADKGRLTPLPTAPATATTAAPTTPTRSASPTMAAPPMPQATVTPEASRLPVNTLAYPVTDIPLYLDPQERGSNSAALILRQTYEGLFSLRGDGTVVPAAAERFQLSDDAQTYVITLREGAKWSDGEPLLAQHFVDGFCRLLDPALGNLDARLLTEDVTVVGAPAYADGQSPDCTGVGFRALDERTLQIDLEEPAAYLPQLLASHLFMPARLDLLSAHPDGWSGAEDFVGNGPYVIQEWAPGDHIVLSRNPTYWDAEGVRLEQIVLLPVPEPAAQLALYEEGAIHVAEIPPEEMPGLLNDPVLAGEVQALPVPGTSYLVLNTRVGPTADVNVRRAIASAIDRQVLIDEVLAQPWHVPALSLIPSPVSGLSEIDSGYAYDSDAALAYLADAGYDEQHPVPLVDIWINREGNNLALFNGLSDMLAQVGIPTRLISSDWDMYSDSLATCRTAAPDAVTADGRSCAYHAYRMGWTMAYPDGGDFLRDIAGPEAASPMAGWPGETFLTLLAQGQAEPDESQRTEHYQAAERMLLEEAVVVPLLHYDRSLLVKEGIHVEIPLFGPPAFQYWELP